MDVSAVVLNKLLADKSLDAWSKLKLAFIDPAYSTVYSAISRHFEKFGELPSFEELELSLREGLTLKVLATLKLIDTSDIDIGVAVEALIDQYTQSETITELDKFIDKLPSYSTTEIKEGLSTIVSNLEDKTLPSETVVTMADVILFKTPDELSKTRAYLGINNDFDAILGGVALEEYIMIGGPRGSGKSVVAANICNNQYEMGNSSIFFTIEMTAPETVERFLAIQAEVPALGLKNSTLTPTQYEKVVRARAAMFEDSDDVVAKYLQHQDRFKFETELIRTKKLKSDNQIVIIDDRRLTLTAIDLHLGKFKAKFGDKLKLAVVDYINQVKLPDGGDQFDWKEQMAVSVGLKNLARKHKLVIVSPYQIDSSGEARFAKGILDSADISLILNPYTKEDQCIGFNTTKIRGGPKTSVFSKMDWDTLRVSPESVIPPDAAEADKKDSDTEQKPKRNKTKKIVSERVDDSKSDTPPWDA